MDTVVGMVWGWVCLEMPGELVGLAHLHTVSLPEGSRCCHPGKELISRKEAMEEEMATHSSTLAWKIPGTEEPGGLQSMGSQSQTRLSDFTSYSAFGNTTLSKTCF